MDQLVPVEISSEVDPARFRDFIVNLSQFDNYQALANHLAGRTFTGNVNYRTIGNNEQIENVQPIADLAQTVDGEFPVLGIRVHGLDADLIPFRFGHEAYSDFINTCASLKIRPFSMKNDPGPFVVMPRALGTVELLFFGGPQPIYARSCVIDLANYHNFNAVTQRLNEIVYRDATPRPQTRTLEDPPDFQFVDLSVNHLVAGPYQLYDAEIQPLPNQPILGPNFSTFVSWIARGDQWGTERRYSQTGSYEEFRALCTVMIARPIQFNN